jgi:hypothetical protein
MALSTMRELLSFLENEGKCLQAPVMGPFVYDVQGFQITFVETVATTYELSAARDGVAGWQVNGRLHYVNATSSVLYVPGCSLQLGSGFSMGRLAAGAVGDLLVFGKDVYGMRQLMRRVTAGVLDSPMGFSGFTIVDLELSS